MLAVAQASKDADDVEAADTLATLTHNYSHLTNCDPYQDMIFVEVDRQVVGYGRVYWYNESRGGLVYPNVGFLLPEWRRKGIGRAVLRHNERRARQLARAHPPGEPRVFQALAFQTEAEKVRLLDSEGYSPVRLFYEMVRPNLDDITNAALPPGVEVRAVRPEHYRAIWEANVEAFRDHWGEEEHTESDYQRWLGNEEFAPDIWKVAWDGDRIAGTVLGFINEPQNVKFNRRRGWTENICVRSPWRRRGLARALIAENLRELKARGMTEAALGVDADNLTGALRLYESLGFKVVKRETVYRKEFE